MIKRWLWFLLAVTSAVANVAWAEDGTGTVSGSNQHDFVLFYTSASRWYKLAAQPASGWYFTSDFSCSSSNGWYRPDSAGYYVISERIPGVTTAFIDAATAFSVTISGRMYQEGPGPGSTIPWWVTGGGFTLEDFFITPSSANLPVGGTITETFTYWMGLFPALSGCWRIQAAHTTGAWESTLGNSLVFPRSSDPCGEYSITAARNTQGARAETAAPVRVVGVQKVEATYTQPSAENPEEQTVTTVTSTTDNPGSDQTIYIPIGESVTITATPNPSGTWPENQPTWKINNSPKLTTNGLTYVGASITFSSNSPGEYVISAHCGTGAYSTKAVKVVVIKIMSMAVESGAVLAKDSSIDWVAVKGEGNVIVKVSITPDIAESLIPPDLISWTGGEAISGQSLHRKVTKTAPEKHIIVALCGNSTASLNVWIMWATVSMQITGSIPSTVPLEFPLGESACGCVVVEDHSTGFGNIFGTVTLLPAGIGSVVTEGWDIKREVKELHIADGEDQRRDLTWVDDDNDQRDEILKPVNDKLYVIDAPNIGSFIDTNIFTRYMNAHEWLEWNGEMCSDKVNWSYRGVWALGSGVLVQELLLEHIEFPPPNQ